MGWSVDNSTSAELAAQEALKQALRAETGADYIDGKQPLIEEFTGEQTNLQTQLNDLVLQSGTDIAEVVQARDGEATLNARLNKTTALLAEKANQSYVDLNKRDKSVKLTQVDLSEDVIAQIAGTAAVNAVPADGIVSPKKTNFLESLTTNLVDVSKLTDGYIDGVTGVVVNAADSKVSDFIEVVSGESYSTNAGSKSGGYYDANKTFVQSIPWNAVKPYVVPTGLGIKYLRASFPTSQWSTARMFKGTTLNDYVPYTNSVKVTTDIKVPFDNLIGSFNTPIDIKQTPFFVKTKNVFDKTKITKESSVSATTGLLVAQTGTAYSASDYIECKPSTAYAKSGSRHVAFYDVNKVFISGLSTVWTFTTPANAKYMRITILTDSENLDKYMVYEGAVLPSTYLPPYELTYTEGTKTPLKIKKWVSYGDSLTNMNVWQPIVAEKLGLTSVVRGIGSTTVVEIGSLAYVDSTGFYVDKPIAWGGTTDTPPAGTTQILSSLSNDQRIATIPIDAEVVTFLAGTNDLNMSKPIGTSIDLNNVAEFKSAYAITIKKIMLRINKGARLITITLPQSNKGTTVNGAGHTPKAYADAIKEVSSMYGIPCIDLFSECGWNEYNMSAFLSDGVHPLPDTGAARMAEVISRGMKGIV